MVRIPVLAAALALLLVAFAAPDDAHAQYTVDQRTAKKLLAIQEALQIDDMETALKLLGTFKPEKMQEYPAALVYQTYGFIYANQDQYEDAASNYQKALDLNALPEGSQLSARFVLGQLYMRMDDYENAIDTFNIWFESALDPNASAYYTLAVAYYQADRTDEALTPALKAVEMTEEPREGWLNLLLAIHMGRKEFKETVPLLTTLVERFPRKPYFVQLAAVFAELGEDQKSVAMQQLAYMQGLLTSHRELTRLAQLLLFNDLPYRAAMVLETGLEAGQIDSESKTWRLLGNAWLASREYERALGPLQTAAELAEDGEMYVRLGQVRIQREEWQEAIEALQQGLEKGGLPIPGQAHLLIGIARYNQKKMNSARAAFVRAIGDEKAKKAAETWLKYLERELASNPQQG